ncbi:MAG: hypothetical protein A3H97_19015 [Acidobacteria bacterium RIFCSPLOWO2_02_FULL_65_29]|nr:MAG: hypothetical protein A3H97_19015 [Acidobacteria bacterium RIFCSPLOWO2_02_FULL_65_29]
MLACDRPGQRLLRHDAIDRDLRIGTPRVVDANGQLFRSCQRRGFARGVIDEVGHLHLTGAQRETHRGRRKQPVGAEERGAEQQELAHAPHARSKSHLRTDYYKSF